MADDSGELDNFLYHSRKSFSYVNTCYVPLLSIYFIIEVSCTSTRFLIRPTLCTVSDQIPNQ